jgi:serine/threonine protein kinase
VIKQQLISTDYKPFAEEIERYFSQSSIVLQDDRNTIKEVEFNNIVFVVKSYKVPSAINSFIYTYLRKSKAWRAYEYGLKAAKFTPKVIARIEYFQPLLTKSYLICHNFEFDFDIRQPLLDSDFPNRNKIFRQFANFVYQLHQEGIFHNDLSPGNILIKQHNKDYHFQIVDVNRMTFGRLSEKNRAKNFDKLWADDKDLLLILTYYANISNMSVNFIDTGLMYNQKNKLRKTRKLNLKKALGLW